MPNLGLDRVSRVGREWENLTMVRPKVADHDDRQHEDACMFGLGGTTFICIGR